jgi:predicted phosphodiesterase
VRFGLIGDVHAEDDLLDATLNALRAERVDRILCTGDLVDGEGSVDRVCSLLTTAGALVVRGNHDRWIRTDEMRSLPHAHRMTDLAVETVALLKGLPATLMFEVPGGRLLLCHGVGGNDMSNLGPDDYGYAISSNEDLLTLLFDTRIRLMVGGHTHRPMVRQFKRTAQTPPLVVVNPGTLARGDEPGFAVLDVGKGMVEFHRFAEGGRIVRATSTVL